MANGRDDTAAASINGPAQPVLVVGGDAMLGRLLAARFAQAGAPVWASTRKPAQAGGQRPYLDLTQPSGTFAVPFTGTGAAILCAAVTSQAVCERDPQGTHRINVEHTVALAQRLVQAGVFVVFLSSNTVFDGEHPQTAADAPPCPVSEYGRQKAQAEAQLLALGPQVAVVRLSKVLAPNAALQRGWATDLTASRPIHPFADAVMAPLGADFAVDLLHRVAVQRRAGITQASASQDISYEQAARHLAERLSAAPSLVQPRSYRDAGIAHMPRHTTLAPEGLRKLGLTQPHPLEALAPFALMAAARAAAP